MIGGKRAAYVAVYQADSHAAWPYDHGDDPSFQASSGSVGRLTWGICRTDLRRVVQEGDLIVFVATDRLRDRTPARYRLSGWATVERRVSHTDIWRDQDLEPYRSYSNLLVRPRSGTNDFEHFEPVEPWHSDWLWRLAPRVSYLQKVQFDAAGASNLLPGGMVAVQGSRLKPAPSYIIFAAEGDGTTVLATPPVIAQAHRAGAPESWGETHFAAELRGLLLGETKRAGLRTTNRQQAHRHVRCTAPADEVRKRLNDLAHSSRLALR